MVTTTAVWEINNKHFSELIGLFLGNSQVTTVVNQISQDVDLKYRTYLLCSEPATIYNLSKPRTVFFRDLAPYEASCANARALSLQEKWSRYGGLNARALAHDAS